jgi:uncharacterized protein involved in exopolysaccharide biosynthesis
MSTIYGENHPQMVNTRAEIQSIRDKMQDEVQRIVQDLGNEVAVARAREQELTNHMARLQGDAARVDLAGVELSDLTREAETNRQLFQTFLTRFREIVEQQGLQEADAKILSAADTPAMPTYPRRELIIGVALLVGALALAWALLLRGCNLKAEQTRKSAITQYGFGRKVTRDKGALPMKTES